MSVRKTKKIFVPVTFWVDSPKKIYYKDLLQRIFQIIRSIRKDIGKNTKASTVEQLNFDRMRWRGRIICFVTEFFKCRNVNDIYGICVKYLYETVISKNCNDTKDCILSQHTYLNLVQRQAMLYQYFLFLLYCYGIRGGNGGGGGKLDGEKSNTE